MRTFNRTFKDIETELNKFISFKTEAALGPWMLPTVETARRWVEDYIDTEMQNSRSEDIVRTLVVVRSEKRSDGDTVILIDRIVGVDTYQTCVAFGCELKNIHPAIAVRSVVIKHCDDPDMGIVEFMQRELERNKDRDIFELWGFLPEHRKKKYPICPVCGGSASVLMGEHDKYHVWCDGGCGWRSKGHMSDYGEVLEEYITDWFPKERKRAIKEQKAKERKESALVSFRKSVTEACKAGVTEDEFHRIVRQICADAGKGKG